MLHEVAHETDTVASAVESRSMGSLHVHGGSKIDIPFNDHRVTLKFIKIETPVFQIQNYARGLSGDQKDSALNT